MGQPLWELISLVSNSPISARTQERSFPTSSSIPNSINRSVIEKQKHKYNSISWEFREYLLGLEQRGKLWWLHQTSQYIGYSNKNRGLLPRECWDCSVENNYFMISLQLLCDFSAWSGSKFSWRHNLLVNTIHIGGLYRHSRYSNNHIYSLSYTKYEKTIALLWSTIKFPFLI